MVNTNDMDIQEVLLALIKHAQEDEHVQCNKIVTWSEYRYCKQKYKSRKIVLRVLRHGSKRLFKKYCLEIQQGLTDITKLAAYKQLQQTLAFYDKDQDILLELIYDYEKYLVESNRFLWALLGERREVHNESISYDREVA